MKKKNPKESVKKPLEELKNRHYFDKHTILIAEIIFLLIAVGLFIWGSLCNKTLPRDIGSSFGSALLVAFIGSIVHWHTETDVEKTVRTVSNETTRRIKDNQKYTENIIKQLNSSIQQIQTKSDQLSDNISHVESMFNLFNGKACTFCKNYIKDIKFSRSDCNLDSFFSKAQKSICILATNLESLSHSLPTLSNCAKRGVDVRIATIHPSVAKSFIIERLIDSEKPEITWNKMKSSLLKFTLERDDSTLNNSVNFHVRTYSGITPTLILIMVDNECYVAYLINGIKSRETIHFLYSGSEIPAKDTPLFYFKKHFDIVWNNCNTKEADYNEINDLTYPID